DSIDMILCAIGGDDTYRLLPYLFENDQLQKVIKQKIFLGFSDTTMNHLMLHKLGIKTFCQTRSGLGYPTSQGSGTQSHLFAPFVKRIRLYQGPS
ncbi:hypothetical protein CSW78_27005, partial [Shigella flexneri]